MLDVDWKLNAMIDKKKILINKINDSWRHPLNRKFKNNHVY